MKIIRAAVVALFLLLGMPSFAQASPGALKNLEVIGVSDRPTFGSGYVITYVRIDFKASDGSRLPIYMIYAGENQRMPELGDRCDIRYTMDAVKGIVGKENQSVPQARLAKSLDCRYRVVSI